jgi:hypothetical protein
MVGDPGKTFPRSWIQGSKKHGIPDFQLIRVTFCKYFKADFDDNPDLWKRDQVHEVLTLVEERVDVSRGDAGQLGEQVPHLNQTKSNRGTGQIVFHFLF